MSTNIPFVDETWNPWQGCHYVSEGCRNCYMYREKKRYGQDPSVVIRSADATFYKPLKMKSGTKVFICSWSDFFIEEADKWRKTAWDIIKKRSDILFVIITKRVERISRCLPPDWGAGYSNVVMGFTAEDWRYFDKRWQVVRRIPCAGYLCMHEPALGKILYPMDFLTLGHRSWVIAGGETGPDARPSHASWFRADRDQCRQSNTPFFFKQWGEWSSYDKKIADFLLYASNRKEIFRWQDGSVSCRVGLQAAGNLLDGETYTVMPIYKLTETELQTSLF